MVTNSDAIKQIKTEIIQLKSEKQVNLSSSKTNDETVTDQRNEYAKRIRKWKDHYPKIQILLKN